MEKTQVQKDRNHQHKCYFAESILIIMHPGIWRCCNFTSIKCHGL